jgi:hypothetical protein
MRHNTPEWVTNVAPFAPQVSRSRSQTPPRTCRVAQDEPDYRKRLITVIATFRRHYRSIMSEVLKSVAGVIW